MENTERDINVRVRAVDEASLVFRKVAESAKKELGGGAIGQLKEAFGRESGLKETLEIFRGAGAVAGLTLGAESIRTMAEGAAKLGRELRDDSVSGGEFVEKLAGLIPIFGQFWQAGRAIRELFTGEEEAAARIKEDAEAGIKFMEARVELEKEVFKLEKEHRVEMIRLGQEGALIGLPAGQKEGQSLLFDLANHQRELVEKQKKDREDLIKASTPAQIAAAKRVAEAQKEFERADVQFGDSPEGPEEFARAKAALAARQQELGKADAEHQKSLTKLAVDAAEERFGKLKNDGRRVLDLIVTNAREQAAQWQKGEEAIGEARASAREKALRTEARDAEAVGNRRRQIELEFQADELRIRQDNETRKAEARRQATEQAARLGDEAGGGALAQANRARAAMDEDAEASIAQKRAERDKRLVEERAREAELEQQRIDAQRSIREAGEAAQRRELEAQGKAGELLLRELDLRRQIRAERERLEDMLREEARLDLEGKGKLSPSAENAARMRIVELLRQEKDAKRLSFRPLSGSAAAQLAPAENAPFDLGIAARFRSQMQAQHAPDPVAKAIGDAGIDVKEIKDFLRKIADPFAKLAPDLARALLISLAPGAAPLIFNGSSAPTPTGN